MTWKARGGERSTFDGRDANGRFYAHATNISGPWTIYLTPWACGREGGLTTGRMVCQPAGEGPGTHGQGAARV